MSKSPGTVFLVGAGPGDPGLITLRGLECLAKADAVLYDYLVNPALLQYAPQHAQRIPLGDSDAGRTMPQQQLLERLVELARDGKTVIRLKGGDPFIFGRGGEEAEALRSSAVPFEIVPGVTAGIAAAAYAGIPLTHRDRASAVVLATVHADPAKQSEHLDWDLLASFNGTLVFYMGSERVDQVAEALIQAGKPAATPAAVVAWGTVPAQRTVWGTLENIGRNAKQSAIGSPAVILVGAVVELGRRLQWFEQRPLFGRCIVVTRPEDQGRQMAERLRELGAETILFPTIRIQSPDDWAPVDEAIDRLEEFDWLVFSSGNGVRFFLGRLLECGHDLRRLGGLQLAAIGSATCQALAAYHLKPDVVPDKYRAEELAAALAGQVAGQHVLLARASRGREILGEQLAAAGAVVERLVVYNSVDVEQADPVLLERLRRGGIDWITLTSSAIARSLARLLGDELRTGAPANVRLASISPLTTQAAREAGLVVTAEAQQFTTAGVIEAIVRACGEKSNPGA